MIRLRFVKWMLYSISILYAIVVGMFCGSELIAYKLSWHASLGQPMFLLNHKIPVYPPWGIALWSYWWGNELPFIRIGWIVATGVSTAIVFLSFYHKGNKHDDSFESNKGWGTKKDARTGGILPQAVSGTVLGMFPDGDLISYIGDEHQLVAGAAGSGKTSGQVVSSLLTWPYSALIYDPKRELYAQTAARRSLLGEAFFYDPTCHESPGFNPLQEVRTGTDNEIGDIQNVVSIILEPSGPREGKRDYFDDDASALLTSLILYALHDLPGEYRNLAAISKMILNLDDTLEDMLHSSHELCRDISTYISGLPDRQKAGVYGSSRSALVLYDDPLVAEKTSRSDFRISDLVCSDRPVSCYIQVRPTDAVRLRPLIRLILTQVAQSLMYDVGTADGRKKNHRLLYLLEEFPSLGRLDFFSSQMRVMRGYGITAMLIVQSFKDIIHTYGRDQTIVDNCRIVVAFAAADPDTLHMISTMLGSTIEPHESISEPRDWISRLIGSSKSSINKSIQRRPLLDPGQVRQLGYNEEIVFVTGIKPLRVRKVQWFKHRALKNLGTNLHKGGMDPGQSQRMLELIRADQRDIPQEKEIEAREDDIKELYDTIENYNASSKSKELLETHHESDSVAAD